MSGQPQATNSAPQPQNQAQATTQSAEPHKSNTQTPNPANPVDFKEIENLRRELEQAQKKNKTYQEEQEKKAKEEAERKGEFQKLYEDSKMQLEKERQANRNLMKQSEIKMKALAMGIKKTEFLKLFDMESVEMDESNNLIGLDAKLEKFRTEYPEAFKTGQGAENQTGNNTNDGANVPKTHQGRINVAQRIDSNDIENLNRIIHDKNTRPSERRRAIAARLALRQKLRAKN